MKTIIKHIKQFMLVIALIISVTACGQTSVREVRIKSDFKSSHCKQRIEQSISKEKGIQSVSADLASQIVTIKYESDKNTSEALSKSVKDLGYASNVMCDKDANAKCEKEARNCSKADSTKCCKGKKQPCGMIQATDSTAKPGCQKKCEKK